MGIKGLGLVFGCLVSNDLNNCLVSEDLLKCPSSKDFSLGTFYVFLIQASLKVMIWGPWLEGGDTDLTPGVTHNQGIDEISQYRVSVFGDLITF